MSKGFFVPNSVGSNYVPNKKTAEGAYQYDQSKQQVGLGQQAAFQSISKQYSSTIDSAFSNYLSANRGIKGSQMGEGYKQAYGKVIEDKLAAQVAESTMNAGQLRQQVSQEGEAAKAQIQAMYEKEVTNMDRVASSANDYLAYLKTLTNTSQTYLTADQMSLSLDDLYDVVFQAQPEDYFDRQGNIGLSYIEFVNSQLKNNDNDLEWSKWLFSQGGFRQFREATKKGVAK